MVIVLEPQSIARPSAVTGPATAPVNHADASAATIAEARALVADLFTMRPWIYWVDLLLTLSVAYRAALVYLDAPNASLVQVTSFTIAGFAMFRAGSFVHEITHLRNGEMLAFRVAWNLLCGIPLVMPSHFYENHIDHHNSHHYGTQRDGEYLPLGAGPWRDILWFFAQVPFLPAYIALRLLLAPLTFLHPKLRNFVLERMSSYVINFRHRLTIPRNAPRKAWAALEIACCLRVGGMLLIPVVGVYPWTRLVQLYALAVFSMLLNYLRNLVAHRYQNTGDQMSHAEQLADSVTISGRPIVTELFFPLGLRYHALHHLFPGIPYHNLGLAHRRLMKRLPPNSAYHRTVFSTYRAALATLWANSQAATRGDDYAVTSGH
jgi:fatty acid desaturase